MKFLRVTMLWIVLLPLSFTYLGAASNQLVLMANHDKFPVMMNDARQKMASGDSVELDGTVYLDPIHVTMTKDTHLNFLSDIFDLKDDGIWSIGDMMIYIGEWASSFCVYIWAAAVARKLWELRD